MEATLDHVMRQLDGLGSILMAIDASLEEIVGILKEDDEEETES